MQRLVLLATAIVLLLTTFSAAQMPYEMPKLTREGSWEFSVQTRYAPSRTYDGDGGSSISFEDDLGWGFGFSYHLSQNFDVGMFFSWRSVFYDAQIVDADLGEVVTGYSSKLDMSTFGFIGNWNILTGRLTPYLSGTLGWVFIDTNIYAGYETGCWWDPWWGYVCGSYDSTYGTTAFVGSLGAGLRFDVTDSFFLRVGYDHAWLDLKNVSDASLIRLDFGFFTY